jgi:predicted protein tyrosine phosphatase
MRKVLFVCTANLQRSPTAEKLFQGWNGVWEARSAGIMAEPDCTQLTQHLIEWADIVIVMEPVHKQFIESQFKCNLDKIHVLNIADRYYRDDPELVRLLRNRVRPILEENQASE